MANLATNDPTQRPDLHKDLSTFDDPIRKVGRDATSTFDNSASNPTEWAGSEALESATEEEDEVLTGEEEPNLGVRADAPSTGIDDADQEDSFVKGDEDVLEDDDEDIEDDDEELLDEDGIKKVH